MLARRLARRGLAVSGGALAAAFSQEAASAAVPISVVASTIEAASMFAAGQAAATGAISVHVTALTESMLKAMFLTKLRIPLTLFLALTLVLASTGVAHRLVQTQAAQPSPKRDQLVPGGQAAAPQPGAVLWRLLRMRSRPKSSFVSRRISWVMWTKCRFSRQQDRRSRRSRCLPKSSPPGKRRVQLMRSRSGGRTRQIRPHVYPFPFYFSFSPSNKCSTFFKSSIDLWS